MNKIAGKIAQVLIYSSLGFGSDALASNACRNIFQDSSHRDGASLVVPLSSAQANAQKVAPSTTSEHFEFISSIVSGSPIYATIGANQKGAGLYKRTSNGWYPVILGEVGRTEYGAPSLTQLEISKIDPKSYAVALVNGRLLLVSGYSDSNHPETLIDFGSQNNPLFEVGSLQKRLLPKIRKADDIAIFQDPVLTSKGSQLVLVSLKIPDLDLFGTGLTFAFEILPNKDNSKIQLNGRPILIDYEYHESKVLGNFVSGETEKFLYSKILVQQFESGDYSSFGDHYEYVQALVTDYAKGLMASLGLQKESYQNPSVAFNITTGRPRKDVEFSKSFLEVPGIYISQKYHTAGKTPTFHINTRWGNYDFTGQMDFTDAKTPAVWHNRDSAEILYSAGDRLHLLIEFSGVDYRMDLGETRQFFYALTGSSEIPNDLVVQYLNNQRSDQELQPAAIFLSGTSKATGAGFTAFIPISSINNKSYFSTGSVVKLLDFPISLELLAQRAVKTETGDILFDSMTPNLTTVASYEQAYDASKPHVDIFQSKSGKLKYKFKKATSELVLAPSLVLADFTHIEGIENPSGIYYNVAPGEVTGNEPTRSVGQVLLNPMRRRKMAPESKLKANDYYLASFKLNAAKKDTELDTIYEEDDGAEPSSFEGFKLFAIDANRTDGASGYKLVLFRANDSAARGPKDKVAVHEIKLSGGISGNFKNLRSVNVVKGRHEGRTYAFMLLGYEAEGRESKTIVLGFNALPSKKFEVKTHVIEREIFTSRDLKDRVAFDDSGLPYIKMSVELSPDSYEFSVLNLANFQIEKPNQAGGAKKRNLKFGDYNGSEMDSRSFIKNDDDWTAWKGNVAKAYPNLGMSASLAQFDSFVDLGRRLDDMANANRDPHRMILVVPASLKDLVMDYVLNKGYSGDRTYGHLVPGGPPMVVDNTFSFTNTALEISIFDKAKANQDQFLANLLYWQKQKELAKRKRNFLIMKYSDLLAASNTGAPQSKNTTENMFLIDDVRAASGDKGLGSVGVVAEKKLPHAFYLLAAGGPFGLKEFQERAKNPVASMIIIATPEEMRGIETAAATEVENNMLKQFEIREIKDPDKESMSFSIAEIFTNNEIKSLNYGFSAKEIKPKAQLNDDENFSTIIAYAVSRFDFLTQGKKDSRLESFMRFRAAFANGVVSDREARKSRLIDKSFVERILTQVFDIPMNLSTLPKDDPLVILSRPDALLKLQDAGYSGPFSLKEKIRSTLLSQTRADAGKPIPSSTILFGATGAGKTFMFKSLVKMLNLKMYNFNSTDNKDASAIIINVGQVMSEGGSNTEGSLDVSQVLKHLDNFLSQPNGFRGYILFDDIHAANDVVKAKLLSYIRGLFESQDGMYTIKTKDTQFKRPIRNLNLFMTLNPTADQDQISKYAKDKAKPSTEEILLATLSTSEFKIEPSFLRRWGRIINLDYMPAGAKGPELVKSIAKASNDLLNSSMKIAIVSPLVIQQLVTQNETVDARSFLSAATNSLVEVAASDNKGGSLVFVVPTSYNFRRNGSDDIEQNAAERITKWVKVNTRTLTLNGNLEGSLTFLKMIIDAYRIPLFENLVMALQEDPRFSGDTNLKNTILAPVLLAMSHHLKLRPYIGLKDINLSANDFGMKTAGERAQFAKVIDEPSGRNLFPLFPKEFKIIDSHTSTWQYIEGKPIQESPYRQTISNSVQQTRKLLEARLSEIMHVADIDQLPSPESWLQNLQQSQDGLAGKRIGKALADELWKFMPALFARNVQDSLAKENRSISIYGAARLYLSVMDRSIVQMPWVPTSKFLLRSLDEITQDQVLSQRAGVQSFLFTDPFRLLKPTLSDYVFQIIASAEVEETISPEIQHQVRRDYQNQYLDYVDPEDGGGADGVEK